MPDREEITRVVYDLNKNKSPGLDGLTAEMVQACWEFVGETCCSINGESFLDRP
jgi:hypothetical protein